jgi:CRISPR-associated protein Cas2
MGWILAMFDLPVMTDEERKAATRFRNDLLDHGYLMIQFSVYARPCVTFDLLDAQIGKIKGFIPAAGNVRLIFLTDEQWKRSHTVIGGNYADAQRQGELPLGAGVAPQPPTGPSLKRKNNREKDPKIPGQVEFWE